MKKRSCIFSLTTLTPPYHRNPNRYVDPFRMSSSGKPRVRSRLRPPDFSTSAAPAHSSSTGSTHAGTTNHHFAVDEPTWNAIPIASVNPHLSKNEVARSHPGRERQAVRARITSHRQMRDTIFRRTRLPRLHPAHTGDSEKSGAQGTRLFDPGMRELSREERDRRAAAGEPFAFASRPSRNRARPSVRRCRLRRQIPGSRRHRRLPYCALTACRPITWPLRRRCRSQDQAFHPRPGPSIDLFEASADL